MSAMRRSLLAVSLLLCLVAIARIALFEPATGTAVASSVEESEVSEPIADETVAVLPKHPTRESVVAVDSALPVEVGTEGADAISFDELRERLAKTDPNTITVVGRLLDPNGDQIVGAFASVELTSASGETNEAKILEDGTYRAVGFGSGKCWIEADAEGFGARTLELFSLTDRGEITQDIQLEPRVVIEVSAVTSDGKPLRNLRGSLSAIATDELPSEADLQAFDIYSHTYGASMRVSRHGGPPEVLLGFVGRLELLEQPPTYVSLIMNQTLIATKFVPVGVTLVNFVLSEEDIESLYSSIRYRLVDSETGAELSNKLNMLIGSNIAMSGPGTNGEVVYGKLAPGEVELIAEVDGYEAFKRVVQLESGVNTDLGDIPLQRSQKLIGTVVDELGDPVTGAIIHYESLEADSQQHMKSTFRTLVARSQGSLGWLTDTDGRFSIAISSGRHRLWAVGPSGIGLSANTVIDSAEPLDEIRIVLYQPKRVTFKDQFERYAKATLQVLDEFGIVISESQFTGTLPITSKLPQGHYRARLIEEEAVVLEHAFHVADLDLTIDF